MALILASASPRRKRLLREIARTFRAMRAGVDERMKRGEGFAAACRRLAREKARAVSAKNPGATVLGADTIAYMGRRAFRKTDDAREARRILRALSGKAHTVATGVCVVFPDGKGSAYCEKSVVRMKKLSARVIDRYIKSGEWRGRAGSYDISGKGRRLVESVRGEKETVAGLPLKKLKALLGREGNGSANHP